MAEKHRRQAINSFFWELLRRILSGWLKRKFNVSAENTEILKSVKAPYIIMPNHVGFWDPFMVAIFIKDPVYYVVSRIQFKNPMIRFLLSLVGGIPKAKGISDLETIKSIMRIKDRGGVIGVFPEGSRNWDGVTFPVIRSTAKLIRLLKIPVIVPLIRGCYFSNPRWGIKPSKGEIKIKYSLLFNGSEVKDMNAGLIADKLQSAVDYNEYEYYGTHKVSFSGKRKAEYIERFLFRCSECQAHNSLVSKGNDFKCSGCRTDFSIDEYMNIKGGKFSRLCDWNSWQLTGLKELIKKSIAEKPAEALFSYSGVIIKCGEEGKDRFDARYRGNLFMYFDRIVFTGRKNSLKVLLKDVYAPNVQNNEVLEFYHSGLSCAVHAEDKRFPSFQWMMAMLYYAELTS